MADLPAPGEYVRYCWAEDQETRAQVLGPSFQRNDRNEIVRRDDGSPIAIPGALELQLMVKVGTEMRIAGGKSGALLATTKEQRSMPGYWWPE